MKTCLWAYIDSEGPDQPVHPCILIRIFKVCQTCQFSDELCDLHILKDNFWHGTAVNLFGRPIALDKMFFFCFFFNPKVLIFVIFLHENIYCGYSLEAPHSNGYPQHMFSRRNKKTIYLIPTLSL